MRVLQTYHLNKVNNGRRTYNIRYRHNSLCEVLMDLSVVEKSILAISMNRDNQKLITIVNSSKYNMKSKRHMKSG